MLSSARTLAARSSRQLSSKAAPTLPKICRDVTQAIGFTPMVQLNRVIGPNCKAKRVLAKLEMQNPGGSVKDRIALGMIEAAERRGEIHPDRTTVVEATSGNTGIGIAMCACPPLLQPAHPHSPPSAARLASGCNVTDGRGQRAARAAGAAAAGGGARAGVGASWRRLRDSTNQRLILPPTASLPPPDHAAGSARPRAISASSSCRSCLR